MLHRWLSASRRFEGTYQLHLNGTHEFKIFQLEEIVSSPKTFRTALGLTQPPLQWVPGFCLGVKKPKRDVDQ
jgi:hypothetical protein